MTQNLPIIIKESHKYEPQFDLKYNEDRSTIEILSRGELIGRMSHDASEKGYKKINNGLLIPMLLRGQIHPSTAQQIRAEIYSRAITIEKKHIMTPMGILMGEVVWQSYNLPKPDKETLRKSRDMYQKRLSSSA